MAPPPGSDVGRQARRRQRHRQRQASVSVAGLLLGTLCVWSFFCSPSRRLHDSEESRLEGGSAAGGGRGGGEGGEAGQHGDGGGSLSGSKGQSRIATSLQIEDDIISSDSPHMLATESAPTNSEWMSYGEAIWGPRHICNYSEMEVKGILIMPHGCKRGSHQAFMRGRWETMDSVVSLLVKPRRFDLTSHECVVICIDHEYPCQDSTCLLPISMRQNSTDSLVVRQMLTGGELDILSPRNNFSSILDAGANCGITATMFTMVFKNAIIVSVEPSSSNFEMLQLNTRAYSRVAPVKAALWAQDTEKLTLSRGGRDLSLPEWGYTAHVSKIPDENIIEQSVKAVSVPSLLKHFALTGFDLVKLDIEGSEYDLFEPSQEGSLEWINSSQVVVVEIHEDMRPNSTRNVLGAFDKLPNWRLQGQFAEYHIFVRDDVDKNLFKKPLFKGSFVGRKRRPSRLKRMRRGHGTERRRQRGRRDKWKE